MKFLSIASLKSQHSDIATGLSTKKYVDSRSPARGRDQSSAPAPHPTVRDSYITCKQSTNATRPACFIIYISALHTLHDFHGKAYELFFNHWWSILINVLILHFFLVVLQYVCASQDPQKCQFSWDHKHIYCFYLGCYFQCFGWKYKG